MYARLKITHILQSLQRKLSYNSNLFAVSDEILKHRAESLIIESARALHLQV